MEKYFIEKSKKKMVVEPLGIGEVAHWVVEETIEYPNRKDWEKAKQRFEIPDVCWVKKDDITFTAFVKYD